MASSKLIFGVLAVAVLALSAEAVGDIEPESNTNAVLKGLRAGRTRWQNLKSEWSLTNYKYRLYRTCLTACNRETNEMNVVDCLLGDHGPFYITVEGNKVTDARLIWNPEPLDTSRFKTIEQIFNDLEAQIKAGAPVDQFWRFDDIQGVPDEVIIRPAGGEPYGTRVVVIMPTEFHLQRLSQARSAWAAKGYRNYSFNFQRLCPGCGPVQTMVVKNGRPVGGGMTMEDVLDIVERVIRSEPLFLDIFYGNNMLFRGMDVDVDLVKVDDTQDTIRVTNFTPES